MFGACGTGTRAIDFRHRSAPLRGLFQCSSISFRSGCSLRQLTALELCAGGGGQALGLEQAGFDPLALVDNDPHACATLRLNRPQWNVLMEDLERFSAAGFRNVDLLAAGVPCPPFSKAGRQLGRMDERDLFPEVLRLVEESRPRAVMLENVRGLLDSRFEEYRRELTQSFTQLGYDVAGWRLIQASDYGVPQLRPRAVCVAIRRDLKRVFEWPSTRLAHAPTVGEALLEKMSERGWKRAEAWASRACRIAPTLVGGSKRHGGPDLGPTRAKREWAALGVDAHLVADLPPSPSYRGKPRLTVEMAAILQGFPPEWKFAGKKTPAYRQVGNAFPPPVAEAVAKRIAIALRASGRSSRKPNFAKVA